MAMRVKQVGAARKPQGSCQVCGKKIDVGDPYKYAKGRYTMKHVRCAACPTWKPSELETSRLAPVYEAQEAAHDALTALDSSTFRAETPKWYAMFVEAVQSALTELAERAREIASEFEESLENMPDGLREGDTGQMIQERIDNLESWADDLESWSPENEEPDFLEDEDESEEDAEDSEEAREATENEWADSVLDEARDKIEELEIG